MVTIDYFSDVLCVWAYVGQIRVDELEKTFGDRIQVRHRFIPIFGDARRQIDSGWKKRGGYPGFHNHLEEVCAQWEHAHLHAQVWQHCQPLTSVTAHLFLKAVWLLLERGELARDKGQAVDVERLFEALQWRIRTAFFEQGRDISRYSVMRELLAEFGIPEQPVLEIIERGEPHAELHEDERLRVEYGAKGSPTFVFNEGRQVLYGNVGYRIIEANIRELLNRGRFAALANWC